MVDAVDSPKLQWSGWASDNSSCGLRSNAETAVEHTASDEMSQNLTFELGGLISNLNWR